MEDLSKHLTPYLCKGGCRLTKLRDPIGKEYLQSLAQVLMISRSDYDEICKPSKCRRIRSRYSDMEYKNRLRRSTEESTGRLEMFLKLIATLLIVKLCLRQVFVDWDLEPSSQTKRLSTSKHSQSYGVVSSSDKASLHLLHICNSLLSGKAAAQRHNANTLRQHSVTKDITLPTLYVFKTPSTKNRAKRAVLAPPNSTGSTM